MNYFLYFFFSYLVCKQHTTFLMTFIAGGQHFCNVFRHLFAREYINEVSKLLWTTFSCRPYRSDKIASLFHCCDTRQQHLLLRFTRNDFLRKQQPGKYSVCQKPGLWLASHGIRPLQTTRGSVRPLLIRGESIDVK